MIRGTETLYDRLGVRRGCSFDALKKAYYRRAKECHPDRFDGDSDKEEEFKLLVDAFNVLSDPVLRREYDERLQYSGIGDTVSMLFRDDGTSVMDSVADDILEEMIVGNNVPRNTTLQTLMLDLTNTVRFIMFREARNRFSKGDCRTCYSICRKLVGYSPGNILYHYYLAESARRLGRLRMAARHYHLCLQIGVCRVPPQRLERIRRRLRALDENRGLVGRVCAWLSPPPPPSSLSEQDDMSMRMNRAFARFLRSSRSAEVRRAIPPGRPRRRLTGGNRSA